MGFAIYPKDGKFAAKPQIRPRRSNRNSQTKKLNSDLQHPDLVGTTQGDGD